jgi:hypothetical protein
MGMQPVITHADPKANGDPVKERGNKKVAPAEHKQRSYRADMKEDQNDGRDPVETLLMREGENVVHRGFCGCHAIPG